MKQTRHYNGQPFFDLSNLDEHYDIIIDYDSNGNPRRFRKVRRFDGCFSTIFLVAAVSVIILWALNNF